MNQDMIDPEVAYLPDLPEPKTPDLLNEKKEKRTIHCNNCRSFAHVDEFCPYSRNEL